MSKTPGVLYVVATPIGNLSDMTPRAVEVLSQVDLIAAEDTRHSKKLLIHFNIKTPLYSCHAHNEANKGDFFIRVLQKRKSVAIITDAGTPCISDPGFMLIQRAAEAGISVVPVCGASAVTAALSVSGFDASRFAFLGFFPRKKKEQDEILQKNMAWGSPVVFYESPKRIEKTLAFLAEKIPAARLCLCNDLTKKFERIYRGTPAQVLTELAENPAVQKGEYTCIIQPSDDASANYLTPQSDGPPPTLSLEARLVELMTRENCDLKTAATLLRTEAPTLRKKEIYAATLRLRRMLLATEQSFL